jgi:hypothetical protein
MKLTVILKSLLILQITLYVWALQLLYSSSHDGVDSAAGIAALLPFGLFWLVGIVSLILICFYTYRVLSRKLALDFVVPVLATIVIVLILAYQPLVDWALTGPR